MPTNAGKLFEEDIKNSIPDSCFVQRLKDGSAGGGEKRVRLRSNNICDYIVFDGQWLHLWELKSHKGNSIPTSAKYNEKGTLTHYGVFASNQLIGLMEEYTKKNVNPGVIVNFRDKGKTIFISILHVYQAVVVDGKKSLSVEWCEQYGTLIPQQRKGRSKIHWTYDLGCLLDNLVHMCGR